MGLVRCLHGNPANCRHILRYPNTFWIMVITSASSRNDSGTFEGTVIVRRFTSELQGQSTLECAAIGAQQEQYAIEEAQREAQMRELFEDNDQRSILMSAFRSSEADGRQQ